MIGDERYDDRLSDPSEEGRERRRAVNQRGAGRAGLHRPDRRSTSRCAARSTCWRRSPEGRSPSSTTAPTGSARRPTSSGRRRRSRRSPRCRRADTPERIDRYEARLRAFPAYMDAWADIAREGARGPASRRRVWSRSGRSRSWSVCWPWPPRTSPAIAPVAGDPDAAQRIADVVRDVVNPRSRATGRRCRRYLPHCTETIGLSALPDGEGIYAALILGVDHAAARPARGTRARARAVRGDPG